MGRSKKNKLNGEDAKQYESITAALNEAEELYEDFDSLREYILLNLQSDTLPTDLSDFQKSYDNILAKLNVCYNEIQKIPDVTKMVEYQDRYEEVLYKTCYVYQQSLPEIQKRQISELNTEVDKLNKKLENSLGTQFGIYSALLSILAFVLNNAKLFSYEEIDFKNILLINLSYILVCAVLFYFVLWFIKPYKHSKGRVWSLVIIIAVLIGAICFIA